MATGNNTASQKEVLYAESMVIGAEGSQYTLSGAEFGALDGVTAGNGTVIFNLWVLKA